MNFGVYFNLPCSIILCEFVFSEVYFFETVSNLVKSETTTPTGLALCKEVLFEGKNRRSVEG